LLGDLAGILLDSGEKSSGPPLLSPYHDIQGLSRAPSVECRGRQAAVTSIPAMTQNNDEESSISKPSPSRSIEVDLEDIPVDLHPDMLPQPKHFHKLDPRSSDISPELRALAAQWARAREFHETARLNGQYLSASPASAAVPQPKSPFSTSTQRSFPGVPAAVTHALHLSLMTAKMQSQRNGGPAAVPYPSSQPWMHQSAPLSPDSPHSHPHQPPFAKHTGTGPLKMFPVGNPSVHIYGVAKAGLGSGPVNYKNRYLPSAIDQTILDADLGPGVDPASPNTKECAFVSEKLERKVGPGNGHTSSSHQTIRDETGEDDHSRLEHTDLTALHEGMLRFASTRNDA